MKKTLIIFCFVFLLLACEETPKYTITYNGNGNTDGSPPIDNNQYLSGSYANVLDRNTLKKAGYKFDGWNTGSDGDGINYGTGSRIKIIDANIFLYAVWSDAGIAIGIE